MVDQRKIILLVEDEAITALLETEQLRKCGYHVLHVLKGEEAVDIVCRKQEPVDLILMDIDLGPGIDGTIAAQEILKTKDIPIVFLSSHTEPEIVEKTEKITSYGYVVKNTGITVLDASIKMAFKLFNANRSLYEHDEMLNTVFQNSPIGLEIYDKEANLIRANRMISEMFGVNSEEYVGIYNLKEDPNYQDPEVWSRLDRGEAVTHETVYDYSKAPFKTVKEGRSHYSVITSPISDKLSSRVGYIMQVIDITHRVVAEQALRDKTKELEGFFLAALDLLCIADTDGTFRRLNPQWENVLGYPISELEGRLFLDFVHPDDKQSTIDAIADLSRQNNVIDFVNRYRCRDGSYRWIEWRSFPSDNIIYAAARDITDRKRAEDEMRSSEERFSEIFHSSPVAIALTRLEDNVIVDVNRSWEMLAGYSHDEVVGRTSRDFNLWVDFGERDELVRQTLDSGSVESQELVMRRKTGELFYVLLKVALVTIEGRTLFLSSAIDLTPLKHAQASLYDAHKRLSIAQKYARAGVWDWDMVTGMLTWSPEFFELFGIDQSTSGASFDAWRRALHPSDLRAAEDRINDAVQKQIPLYNEYRIIRPNGDEVWIAAYGNTDYDESNRPVRMVGICVNITERKRVEEALRRREADLREAQRVGRLGSWEWDAQTDTITWSDEYYRIYGFDPAQPPPGYVEHLKAYTQESAAKLDAAVKRNMETGEPYEIDLELACPDAPSRWITARSETKRDKNGKIIGLRGTAQDITDRKRAEEALRESEIKFRAIFEQAGDYAMILDPLANPPRIIDVNDSACRAHGYTREQMIGMSIADIDPSSNEERHQKIFEDFKAGNSVSFETIHRRRGGTVFPVEVCSNLISIPGKSPIIFTVERDITGRKWAEEALQESEERYRLLIESTNDAVMIHALLEDGRPGPFSLVNELACERFGYSREEFARLSPQELNDPGHLGHIPVVMEQLMTAGHAIFETVMVRKDGGRMPVEISTRMLKLRGHPYIVSLVRDVTERKLAEEALRKSEFMYRSLIEYSNDVIFCVDRNGCYKFVNHVFASTLGKTPDYFDGKSFWDVYPKEHADQRQEASLKVFETGMPGSVEVTVPLPDRTLYYLAKTNPIKDEAGNVILNLTHAIDITDRKVAEEKVKSLLLEKELILREVHHRIKNNMNTVSSLLMIEADGQGDKRVKQILAGSIGRIKSMMVLYDKLYRSEHGDVISMKEYLSSLIDEIVEIMPRKWPVKVQKNISGVMINARILSSLGIILNELITNTLKHAFPNTNDGEISIMTESQGDLVSLIFRDNGVGLPESVTFENPGGFGLQLVSLMVKQIKGTIVVDRNGGTKYIITFPVA